VSTEPGAAHFAEMREKIINAGRVARIIAREVLDFQLAYWVVVMLAPLTLFEVVNHKTIVALLLGLALVSFNAVCNFTCRHFHKIY
jgi:hypothetical protein